MNILVVAATEKETGDLGKKSWQKNSAVATDFLITGAGMTATTYAMTRKIAKKKYDLALNIGLAGVFREEIKIGEVVNVVTDCFGDLGAEDGDKFLTLSQLGFLDEDKFPFWNGKLKADEAQRYECLRLLKNVKAITVNKVHGNEINIKRVVQKFQPDIESMEGAAFFYVCMMEKIPCIQLRAISNRVERRNRIAWNIDLSIQNLKHVTSRFIEDLQTINA